MLRRCTPRLLRGRARFTVIEAVPYPCAIRASQDLVARRVYALMLFLRQLTRLFTHGSQSVGAKQFSKSPFL